MPSREGRQICVHGDYDADGICATALAVLVLRELGADVTWHLPSRFDEGYGARAGDDHAPRRGGLRARPDRRLRRLPAVDEVAHARELGLDVVVTDHHRAGRELPTARWSARTAATTRSPSSAAPAWSGSSGRRCSAPTSEALARHLDLVAVATVADVVPLVDENRGLAVAGLRQLARSQQAGLQELMRSARVDPATVDAGSDRLPAWHRALNAAGRLGRPEAALELLLTEEREQAARLRWRPS